MMKLKRCMMRTALAAGLAAFAAFGAFANPGGYGILLGGEKVVEVWRNGVLVGRLEYDETRALNKASGGRGDFAGRLLVDFGLVKLSSAELPADYRGGGEALRVAFFLRQKEELKPYVPAEGEGLSVQLWVRLGKRGENVAALLPKIRLSAQPGPGSREGKGWRFLEQVRDRAEPIGVQLGSVSLVDHGEGRYAILEFVAWPSDDPYVIIPGD
ncbi:MAG: hypothetical protein JNG85_04815 [Spirochaetaceae bacterium]|nr:hypothetical protein [Spirochaetaceae bacterium]